VTENYCSEINCSLRLNCFVTGVAVAVLGRKLYAIGGFDGRNRLRRFV